MQSNERKMQRIGFIGFGEAGGILGDDFARQGCAVAVYDILIASPASATLRTKVEAARS